MLPTDFLGTNSSNPHEANYHLWVAAGDADVTGGPGSDVGKSYHLYEARHALAPVYDRLRHRPRVVP